MPYFERTDTGEYTRRFDTVSGEDERWEENESDDGFDELLDSYPDEYPDPEEETPNEEERLEARRQKFRIAAGIGDLGAVLLGAAVILGLVAFLISMLRFISSDFSRTFSLWQTRF